MVEGPVRESIRRWIWRQHRVASAVLLLLGMLLGPAKPARADADLDYVVQPGDNPWSLTERFLRGIVYWPKLQVYNHIRDARHIPPGTLLHVPINWLRLQARTVRVLAVQGTVSASATPGMAAQPVEVGSVFAAGTEFETGREGSIALEFADGSQTRLLPDSVVEIVRSGVLAAYGGTVLRLKVLRGKIENAVRPRDGPGGRFEIEAPAAVAAVRGTQFRVGVAGDASQLEVLQGTVEFGNAQGLQRLNAGLGSIALPGQAPQPGIGLLPAPDLARIPSLIERLPVHLAFPGVPGAVAYRTQLAADAGFLQLDSTTIADSPAAVASDPADGNYVMRVRGIAASGLEGLDAETRITVHARPEPPLLIEPAGDSETTELRPVLGWTERPGVRYHLQLADNPGFASVLLDADDLAESVLVPAQDLPHGDWYWRIASRVAGLPPGPWSDVQHFRRTLAAPRPEPPTLSGDALSLAWQDNEPGVQFQLQIASDAGFTAMLVEAQTAMSRYTWQKAVPGTCYLRVRALTPDGFNGPWSPVQSVSVPAHTASWTWLLLLLPFLLVQ